jgi:gas vesicle protein
MKAFLFGLGLGMGLGILFAPMSGRETRENLAERANDLASSAKESFEQGRERIRSGIGAVHPAPSAEPRATGTETSL